VLDLTGKGLRTILNQQTHKTKINITLDNLSNNQYLTRVDEDAPYHPEISIALAWQFH
jgi:hypothetical protein